jgi:hypothetical protein
MLPYTGTVLCSVPSHKYLTNPKYPQKYLRYRYLISKLCDHSYKLQALYKINKNASTNNRLRRMPERLPEVNCYVEVGITVDRTLFSNFTVYLLLFLIWNRYVWFCSNVCPLPTPLLVWRYQATCRPSGHVQYAGIET